MIITLSIKYDQNFRKLNSDLIDDRLIEKNRQQYLFPPGVVWNLIMYRNGKLGSLYGTTLPKISIISKKASNKSCLELNFIQESPQVHMFIRPRSEARVLQRSICWNLIMYRNVKLGPLYGSTLPKIRTISKKAFNKSCLELNFVLKSPRAHMSISPRNEARRFKINMFKIL